MPRGGAPWEVRLAYAYTLTLSRGGDAQAARAILERAAADPRLSAQERQAFAARLEKSR